MTIVAPIDATRVCEDILRSRKKYNEEHCILPSEIRVIDLLLNRKLELARAYEELHGKLHKYPNAISAFFDVLLGVAAFWNREDIETQRTARDRMTQINQQIATKAGELANLLEERSNLENSSQFSSSGYYHILDLVEAASTENYLFNSFLKRELRALRGQFDSKYWPSLNACFAALAEDTRAANVLARDVVTAAATGATRPSLADFFKGLFAAINEAIEQSPSFFPSDFRLSDEAIASLVNCALDLEAVEGAYVKRLRQRERHANRNAVAHGQR